MADQSPPPEASEPKASTEAIAVPESPQVSRPVRRRTGGTLERPRKQARGLQRQLHFQLPTLIAFPDRDERAYCLKRDAEDNAARRNPLEEELRT